MPPANYITTPEGSPGQQPCLAVKFATDNEFPILGANTLDSVLVTVDNADSTIRFKAVPSCTVVFDFGGGSVETV